MKPIKLLLPLLLCGLSLTTRAAAPDPTDRSNVPIEQQPTDPKLAKIVLIAGDMGTGHPPGDHEHFAGCALFYRMLQQTPGVAPVMVKDGWPANAETLKDAKAVVFYSDGVGKQVLLKHADEMDKLVAAGVGIVHLHQVIDYPADAVPQAIKWLGGAYHPKTGTRGHWDYSFSTFPEHAVTRGVEPFTHNDGWILSLTWVDGMKGITPILRTWNPKAKAPKAKESDDIVCWTYDRPDGGRSFVLTGGHEHKNWGLPGFRRLVTNGILWSAKVEIPKEGAKVDLDPAQLMTNMDKKPPKAKPATKPAAVKPAEVKTPAEK
jgi:type 1 glutamine amidotransferase